MTPARQNRNHCGRKFTDKHAAQDANVVVVALHDAGRSKQRGLELCNLMPITLFLPEGLFELALVVVEAIESMLRGCFVVVGIKFVILILIVVHHTLDRDAGLEPDHDVLHRGSCAKVGEPHLLDKSRDFWARSAQRLGDLIAKPSGVGGARDSPPAVAHECDVAHREAKEDEGE